MSQEENNKPKEITEAEIKAEMEANTAMQKYFKQFEEYSVNNFITSYTMYKRLWLHYGKQYVENKEYHSIKWVSKAVEHLIIIQQKKLFDMQCLWHAEKITIPQVKICYDFLLWEKDVLNCPFLDPVSEDDIDLYAQYLQSENSFDGDEDYMWSTDEWQDYDEIKEAYETNNENRNFPEWYDFHNGRRGAGVYMTLPNIRGEKEEHYRSIAREANRKENEKNNPPQPYVAPNNLWYHDIETREWFIKTFETKEVQEYYAAYQWNERNSGLEEDLEYYLNILYEADEPVPMLADLDWAEAIKKSAIKYRNQKIAEALPQAWEQYMINIQMNIAFDTDIKFEDVDNEIREMYIKSILKGRKLNGEPEDLDF